MKRWVPPVLAHKEYTYGGNTGGGQTGDGSINWIEVLVPEVPGYYEEYWTLCDLYDVSLLGGANASILLGGIRGARPVDSSFLDQFDASHGGVRARGGDPNDIVGGKGSFDVDMGNGSVVIVNNEAQALGMQDWFRRHPLPDPNFRNGFGPGMKYGGTPTLAKDEHHITTPGGDGVKRTCVFTALSSQRKKGIISVGDEKGPIDTFDWYIKDSQGNWVENPLINKYGIDLTSGCSCTNPPPTVNPGDVEDFDVDTVCWSETNIENGPTIQNSIEDILKVQNGLVRVGKLLNSEIIKKYFEDLESQCPSLKYLLDCLKEKSWKDLKINIINPGPITASGKLKKAQIPLRDKNGKLILDKDGNVTYKFYYVDDNGFYFSDYEAQVTRNIDSDSVWTSKDDVDHIDINMPVIDFDSTRNGTDPEISMMCTLFHEMVHVCGGGEMESYFLQNKIFGELYGKKYETSVDSTNISHQFDIEDYLVRGEDPTNVSDGVKNGTYLNYKKGEGFGCRASIPTPIIDKPL